MRSVMEFIKEEDIIEGDFKLNRKKYNLGFQPEENVVYFKKKNDKNVYKGFMFCKGYAVSIVRGAK